MCFRPSQKVRARYEETPTLSGTLEKLVENEKGEKKRKATEGLLWLLRGLSFTCKALQNAQANASEELAAAFSKSYDVTLKAFHNFVVKGIFSVSSPSFAAESLYRAFKPFFLFILGRDEGLPLSRRFLQQVESRPRWGTARFGRASERMSQ